MALIESMKAPSDIWDIEVDGALEMAEQTEV